MPTATAANRTRRPLKAVKPTVSRVSRKPALEKPQVSEASIEAKVVPLRVTTPIEEQVAPLQAVVTEGQHPKQANAVDEMLVAKAQSGDTRAFEMLMLKHQSRIAHISARIVGEADAPDITQLTFIKAWRALGSFKGESQFYTWIYRIAVNTAKNHLVSRARRSGVGDIEMGEAEEYGHTEFLSDGGTPERLVLADEIKEKVFRAIEDLPHVLKQAIVLREIEGLSYDEIAEVEQCPVGTVRSRIFRAREVIDRVVQPLMA